MKSRRSISLNGNVELIAGAQPVARVALAERRIDGRIAPTRRCRRRDWHRGRSFLCSLGLASQRQPSGQRDNFHPYVLHIWLLLSHIPAGRSPERATLPSLRRGDVVLAELVQQSAIADLQ